MKVSPTIDLPLYNYIRQDPLIQKLGVEGLFKETYRSIQDYVSGVNLVRHGIRQSPDAERLKDGLLEIPSVDRFEIAYHVATYVDQRKGWFRLFQQSRLENFIRDVRMTYKYFSKRNVLSTGLFEPAVYGCLSEYVEKKDRRLWGFVKNLNEIYSFRKVNLALLSSYLLGVLEQIDIGSVEIEKDEAIEVANYLDGQAWVNDFRVQCTGEIFTRITESSFWENPVRFEDRD